MSIKKESPFPVISRLGDSERLFIKIGGDCVMELKQLDYLIAVAESGSMHLAAERLHVSQQNISRVLKQLELELRMKIFNKSTTGTQLTPEGEKIYLHALEIRKEVQLLLDDITTFSNAQGSSKLKDNLTVYYSNAITSVVNSYIFPFQKLYNNILFSVVETKTNDILSNILNNEQVCFAFFQLSMKKLMIHKEILMEKYECYLLSDDALKLAMHKNNPLVNRSNISLKKLSTLPFVCRTSSFDNLPEHIQTVLDMGIPLNLKYCSNSDSALTEYMKQNNAFCLATNTNYKSFSNDEVTMLPIKERIYISLYVLLPKEKNLSMQLFSDHIIANMPSYSQKLF